jgi:flagellar hook assembly protein FlgD
VTKKVERDETAEFVNSQSFETIESYFLVSDYNSEEDYFYRVYAVDYAGNSSDHSITLDATALSNKDLTVPNRFFLHQNYPNPFNPTTRINYDMSNDGNALIQIMDVKGNHVRTLVSDYVQMGPKSIVWDARNNNGEKVPAGIYFYTFKTDTYIQTQKMVLLK